jgi:hypothetical protein
MKRTAAALLLLLVLLLTAAPLPAHADLCALDHVPAATLLLPYFEVDLNDPAGRSTLFSINNSRAEPTLAHVVLWTDLAVPTLTFDVYLTGYDIETINLRDVLTGRLPRTADLARDPADTTSPKGDFSQDATFPGCEGLLPPPTLPPDLLGPLQSAHTGQPSPLQGGQCAGLPHGDTGIARGYVTIDVATRCSSLRPGDPGYFGAGGVAGFDNVLWGDFFYVDPSGRFAEGDNLVRIEADPARFAAGGVTFYGRYVNGTGADGREPLPTLWATRFLTGGGFDGGTDLVAWREVPWNGVPFPCGTPPAGFPLAQKELISFDEEEHPFIFGLPPFPEFPPLVPTPFAAAATRVQAGGAGLPLPSNFGWILADLSPYVNAPADPYAQGWIGQVSTSRGRYSVGFQGTALNSLCAPDRCPTGQETATGQLCVGPTQAGAPAHFTVTPKGCFSTSCHQLAHAGCAVVDEGASLRLDSLLCIATVTGPFPCINDCSGIGTAGCDSGPLASGIYTARLGGLALNFQVPGDIPTCVSSP